MYRATFLKRFPIFIFVLRKSSGQKLGSYLRDKGHFFSKHLERDLRYENLNGNHDFQLQLHWETGYKWNKEKNLCAQCIDPECKNGSIILEECNKTKQTQRWTYGKITNKIVPEGFPEIQTQCISYPNLRRVTVRSCRDDRNGWQNLELKNIEENKAQVRSSGNLCLSVRGRRGKVPAKGNLLQMLPCSDALSADLAFWKTGTFDSSDPRGLNTIVPIDSPTSEPTSKPTKGPTKEPTREPITPIAFDYKNGFLNSGDVCKIQKDGICPCYPQDDDGYCSNYYYGWFPWDLSTRVNNVDSDVEYERCDESKFQRCGPSEKLCPMRKPRLEFGVTQSTDALRLVGRHVGAERHGLTIPIKNS